MHPLNMKQSQCEGGDLSDLIPGSERLKLSRSGDCAEVKCRVSKGILKFWKGKTVVVVML